MTKIALAIHGGCGVMPEDSMTAQEWSEARDDLAEALRAGYTVLKTGGTALAAVEAAVMVMEDSPHFNAGHGAALNEKGIHELDASIMDGATLAAGAISAARSIRNPGHGSPCPYGGRKSRLSDRRCGRSFCRRKRSPGRAAKLFHDKKTSRGSRGYESSRSGWDRGN